MTGKMVSNSIDLLIMPPPTAVLRLPGNQVRTQISCISDEMTLALIDVPATIDA